MKKRILFFMPYLYLGGAETQFRNLINGIAQLPNYKIEVIVLGSISKHQIKSMHPSINLRTIGLGFRTAYDTKLQRNFSYIINYIWSYFFMLLLYASRGKYDVSISYRLLLTPLIPLFKVCSKKVIFSERTASQEILNKKEMAFFYKMANHITCNSPITQEYLKKIGVNGVKIIYNGIDFNQIIPPKLGNEFKHAYVIARIHPLKNQMVVLEAVKNMKNIKVSFIGENTDDNYKNLIIRYITENNITHQVEFIDYAGDILYHYKKADFIILPSLEEGMSNVILESLLHHRHIIASNIPANKIILNGKGRLFDPSDANSLTKEIENLIFSNRKNGIESLQRNSTYIQSHFSVSKMIDNYKNLIES